MQLSNWLKSCLLAALAFGGGAASLRLYEQSACPPSPLRSQDFACVAYAAESVELPALRDEVRARLARSEGGGKLLRAGVLFQRLNDGLGFSVGDEHSFVPASLLKLPIAFAIFMLEAQQPGALAHELPYTVEQTGGFGLASQIEVSAAGLTLGQRYTLEQLLRAVIVHSDNRSYYVLIAYMNAERDRNALLVRTFRELGIQDPSNLDDEAASVREYAGLFRLLYNTAYLDEAASAKLLAWLSESTYDKGLGAGTPPGIRIANKFAERVAASDEAHYLHDCGIVYTSDDPYVLCVMTKGRDFAALQEVVSQVSSAVYSAVAAGRR